MQNVKIVFLIFPEVHLMDLAGPDQVFLEANGYGAKFNIEYCSIQKQVKSSNLLSIANLEHYSKIIFNDCDYLFLPGSNLSYFKSNEYLQNKNLHNWIIAIHKLGVKICTVCSGAFALAETGLLNDRQCTTHWKRTKEFQQDYPKTKVIDNILFTEDNTIYTSAGIASGIDLALHIVSLHKGEYFANKVAREMVVYTRRTGNQKQQNNLLSHRNHIHQGIHKVQDYLQENLHQKNSLDDLSAVANMSTRNFTRIFKTETSLTVNEYITLLRKEKISQLNRMPDISKYEMALQCGLTSERQLHRISKA